MLPIASFWNPWARHRPLDALDETATFASAAWVPNESPQVSRPRLTMNAAPGKPPKSKATAEPQSPIRWRGHENTLIAVARSARVVTLSRFDERMN